MARARVNPVAVLCVVAALPTVGLGALWRVAEARKPRTAVAVAAPDPASLPAPMTTPLLSVRRAPTVLATAVNLQSFRAALAPVVAQIDENRCLEVSIDGQLVVSTNETAPLAPGSAMKLLTAAVALDVLGPGFTYTTSVTGNLTGGVVDGNLYLIGGGDPVLATEGRGGVNAKWPPFNETSVEALVDSIRAAGVTTITGGVVGDASRYDGQLYSPTWAQADRNSQAGPISALLINDGFGQDTTDPAKSAAALVEQLLEARGVTIAQPASSGTAQAAPQVASIASQPLPAILAEMLSTSDNNTAELILKEIGLAAAQTPTREAGLRVITERLAAWGIDTTGLVLLDGSGLTDETRVSCAVLLAVLQHGSADDPVGAGLPVAATPGGTLVDSFVGTAMAGKLRAKTGTLNTNCNPGQRGAKSLAGYLPEDGGGAVEFVLMQNGSSVACDYQAMWKLLGEALAQYPSGPTAAALAPK